MSSVIVDVDVVVDDDERALGFNCLEDFVSVLRSPSIMVSLTTKSAGIVNWRVVCA